MKRLVSADAAIDTDDEFVAISDGLLQCSLPNSITFSETMGHMEAGAPAKQLQRPQKDRCAGGPINVVVAVNQHALARIDCPQQTSDCLFHAEHEVRIVKLVI